MCQFHAFLLARRDVPAVRVACHMTCLDALSPRGPDQPAETPAGTAVTPRPRLCTTQRRPTHGNFFGWGGSARRIPVTDPDIACSGAVSALPTAVPDGPANHDAAYSDPSANPGVADAICHSNHSMSKEA
ncbi:hypothetical protein GPOL_c28210 [Gordonia polyisoprenivorans VH2]|uniref:Uncharacterized protein n=1 Tax=Gordonia polyisoprenivorans (strain DSM 44266 / VH2) TaxID=1112204 RepID=H6MSS3_GORPV|nr:hypothetical protein GPOL_c28210 [Gordonia polyisoprenivorans VH2]